MKEEIGFNKEILLEIVKTPMPFGKYKKILKKEKKS